MKKTGTVLIVSHLAKTENKHYQSLIHKGYTCSYLNTDTEALAFFEQQQAPLGLIITEFFSPNIDTIQIISHLRHHPHLQTTPLICTMQNTTQSNIITAYKHGVKHCIPIDLPPKIFMAIVKNCIQEGLNIYSKELQLQKTQTAFATCQITASFFLESRHCTNYDELANLLLTTVKTFPFKSIEDSEDEHYLRCTIRINTTDTQEEEENIVHVSDRGMISNLDCLILRRATDSREKIEKLPYTALPSASGNTAILIRNTPLDPKEGELACLIIQNLINRFDEQLHLLQQELKVRRQTEELKVKGKQIHTIVTSCARELEHVNTTYQAMKEKQMDILEQLAVTCLAGVDGLSDAQVALLQQNSTAEMMKLMDLYGEDQITDQKFMLTIQELHRILGREDDESDNLKPKQMAKGNDQENVDDLLASLGL